MQGSTARVTAQQFLQPGFCFQTPLLHGTLQDSVDLLDHFLVRQRFLKLQQGIHIGSQCPGQRAEKGNVGIGIVGFPFADGRCRDTQHGRQLFLGEAFCLAEGRNACTNFHLFQFHCLYLALLRRRVWCGFIVPRPGSRCKRGNVKRKTRFFNRQLRQNKAGRK